MKAPDAQQIPGRWSRKQRDLATISWVSLLTAVAGSVIIFALIDPPHLSSIWSVGWELDSVSGHIVIFLFVWLLAFGSAAGSLFMLRTGPRAGHARGKDGTRVPTSHDPRENNPDFENEDWL